VLADAKLGLTTVLTATQGRTRHSAHRYSRFDSQQEAQIGTDTQGKTHYQCSQIFKERLTSVLGKCTYEYTYTMVPGSEFTLSLLSNNNKNKNKNNILLLICIKYS
jgi:hypothetical protein